jgi:hypothetical protein
MNRYVIVCATAEQTSETRRLASQHCSGTPVEMNNYDGTSDFIVTCSDAEADALRAKGLNLTQDKALYFEQLHGASK